MTAFGEAFAHLTVSVLSLKLSLWKSVPHLKLCFHLLQKVCTFYGTQGGHYHIQKSSPLDPVLTRLPDESSSHPQNLSHSLKS